MSLWKFYIFHFRCCVLGNRAQSTEILVNCKVKMYPLDYKWSVCHLLFWLPPNFKKSSDLATRLRFTSLVFLHFPGICSWKDINCKPITGVCRDAQWEGRTQGPQRTVSNRKTWISEWSRGHWPLLLSAGFPITAFLLGRGKDKLASIPSHYGFSVGWHSYSQITSCLQLFWAYIKCCEHIRDPRSLFIIGTFVRTQGN